jgi:hypothetical protein
MIVDHAPDDCHPAQPMAGRPRPAKNRPNPAIYNPEFGRDLDQSGQTGRRPATRRSDGKNCHEQGLSKSGHKSGGGSANGHRRPFGRWSFGSKRSRGKTEFPLPAFDYGGVAPLIPPLSADGQETRGGFPQKFQPALTGNTRSLISTTHSQPETVGEDRDAVHAGSPVRRLLG